MGLFDSVLGVGQTLGTVANTLGSGVQGALGTVGRIAGALNNLSNPASLVSALRSASIPTGAIPGFSGPSSTASMGGSDSSDDWRVRLSVPQAAPFQGHIGHLDGEGL